MENGLIAPDWRNEGYKRLRTSRTFKGRTLWLPVAGIKVPAADAGLAAPMVGYSRLFPRDTLTSAFLLGDSFCDEADEWPLLEAAIVYFASQQGRKPVVETAEEPGKIFHELEGIPLRGLNTLYCACDTTPLFLIACERYAHAFVARGVSGQAAENWRYLKPRIAAAMVYLRAHLEDGLFLESPRLSGAERFALLATYWRDGGIPGRPERKLVYPAAFLLVQAQVIAALRAVLRLVQAGLFDEEEERLAGEVKAAGSAFRFYFDRDDSPVVAWDSSSTGEEHRFAPISFLATDQAHALWYLEPGDVSDGYYTRCREILSQLETPFGWRTWKRDIHVPGMDREPLSRKRDLERIWPWEHAFIAEGFARHAIGDVQEIAMWPLRFLATTNTPFSEYLVLRRGKPLPAGCQVQLWTVATWAWQEHCARPSL